MYTYLYPYIKENVKFFKYPKGNWYVKIYDNENVKTWTIKDDAMKVIKLVDGLKSFTEIYNVLRSKYEINESSVINFFNLSENKNILGFRNYQNETIPNIIGSGNIPLPQHASIEITTKCNLNCCYCYNDSSPNKNVHMSFENADKIFRILHDNGVTEIEITGGEPLIHNSIVQIIEKAFYYFEKVAILTNGVYINDNVLDIINKNRPKFIGFQVSIDGSNEMVTQKLRRVPNTFNKTYNNIKKLISFGLLSRISMVITEDNIDDLEETCKMIRSLNFKNFSISVASNIGRGGELATPFEKFYEYREYIRSKYGDFLKEINKKYSDIFIHQRVLNNIPKESTYNCGAGWRTIVISVNGDIKACPTDIATIGNILSEDYISIFLSEKVKIYSNFSLKPYIEGNICEKCPVIYKCGSCFSRITEMNKRRMEKKEGFCKVFEDSKLSEIYSPFIKR